mmetsp:Transcript_31603/g.33927  ORF Transcript_31603/g.33927 Transcript_31603/m.33927 type:complete len:81 (-) Transcript_31603:16-258(-)
MANFTAEAVCTILQPHKIKEFGQQFVNEYSAIFHDQVRIQIIPNDDDNNDNDPENHYYDLPLTGMRWKPDLVLLPPLSSS